MAFAFPAFLSVLSGLTFVATGVALFLLRPSRNGVPGFGAYAALLGLAQVLAFLGPAFGFEAGLLGYSWPLVAGAAVALAWGVARYTGRSAALIAGPFAVLGVAGVLVMLAEPRLMMFPNGDPNDVGVVLWQVPLFLAMGLGAFLLERSRRKGRSAELRTESLLLIFALVPNLGYTSAVAFLVAAGAAEAYASLWGFGYFVAFGSGLLLSLIIAFSLWRGGGTWERRVSLLIVAVIAAGLLQFALFPGFVLFGGFLRIIAAILLGYGLLKYGLFGIDLTIKSTIHKGTILGVFASVFFLVDQLAQYFVSELFGAFAGLLAAMLIFLVLAPLRQFAKRAADRVMPQVNDSAEYATQRRFVVYRAAAEAVAHDGVVTPRERAMLDSLKRELGISPTDADRVEREAMANKLGF